MNSNVVQGKWKEIKGEVQKAWGKLTGDELDQTKGDMTAIGGLIQQKYGMKVDEYTGKLKDIYGRFENSKDQKTEEVKEALKS